MKKKLLTRVLCASLSGALLLGGCGSDKANAEDKEERGRMDNSIASAIDNATSGEEKAPGTEKEAEPTEAEVPAENETTGDVFAATAANADQLMAEALEQYRSGDHTPLDEPVQYNVLWLGFTHVTYNDLDFQMTDFDREYLEAVALNFEKSLESITDHNLDITVDLHFIDDVTELTKTDGDEWLFLAQDTVQPVIDQYVTPDTDTVLTTVQTAGEENVSRNEDKDGYGTNYVMLGLKTAGIDSYLGYTTFDLGKPVDGTYPLEDPEIPSLYATAVAVHEWMHQFEYLGKLLDVEYPSTHAYMGGDSFPGYQEYINGENDYDYFEFYKLVLTGELPYNSGVGTSKVGMYPKMWPLVKRNVLNAGNFTIKDADGSGYLSGQTVDPTLTLSKDACVWNIRYIGDGRYTFTPMELQDKLIDLGNAWDMEDNTISLWVYTGYTDAQSWKLPDNGDGTYSLQTPYESGRLLTIRDDSAFLCTDGADGIQDWIIEAAK